MFHRSGIAYTYNGHTVKRYYCKACLNHEIEVVRAAREQFSQNAHASLEVLRDIGKLRMHIHNLLSDV